VREETLVSELRLLAAGFLDLARVGAAGPRASAPAEGTKPEATGTAGSTAAMAPPAMMTPPVPVRQELPRWVPYDAATKQAEYKGAVKVRIAADGKVEGVEIVTPTDRQYDRQLLNAARGWLYEPATRNGVAIPSEKVVSVHLRPR
jgi:periplasmic protein TonB